MSDFNQARDALTKAADAAQNISDFEKRADTLTAIGHGFIRLGEAWPTGQRKADDTGAGFQPHSGQDDR